MKTRGIRQSKNDTKRLETAETILLQNDLRYYDVLKAEFSASNSWDEEYLVLLKKSSTLVVYGNFE